MDLKNLSREQLEEIVKEMYETLRMISIHHSQIWSEANSHCAEHTRAKVQKMIEEAEGE